MILAAHHNEFCLEISSVADGVQPAAGFGTTVTPAQNAYGSYASIISGANVTDDVYEIWINANSSFTSAEARDALLTLGIDPAGGTSFTDLINHLLISCSGESSLLTATAVGGGIWYRFPVFIKAGTSIGAKASVNNATVRTVNVHVVLMCRPTHPELLRVGTFVRTFGADTAVSAGTGVTLGGAAEGSFVQLGSALAEPLWYWEVGMGVNDASMTATGYHVDVALGDASNKKLAIRNAQIHSNQTESLSKPPAGRHRQGAIGDLVYGRVQARSTNDTSPTLIAYGVGG